jgi:hypothetical protein
MESAMTPKMDDEGIERMIDIIGDGELTAEAKERLHQEGLWPLYESLRQTAYARPLCLAIKIGSGCLPFDAFDLRRD